ncbi:MAG: hypothetical protein JSU03_01485 [Bacteroidetes bacterium]|nr:hypothetical protein [Bacteroidota bacterium]
MASITTNGRAGNRLLKIFEAGSMVHTSAWVLLYITSPAQSHTTQPSLGFPLQSGLNFQQHLFTQHVSSAHAFSARNFIDFLSIKIHPFIIVNIAITFSFTAKHIILF